MSHLVFDYERDDIIAYLKSTSLFEMHRIFWYFDVNFDNIDDLSTKSILQKIPDNKSYK